MARKSRDRIILRRAGAVQYRATLLGYGAIWKKLQGANGTTPGFEAASFDDSAWDFAPGAFGYVLDGVQAQGPTNPPCVMNRTLVNTAWDLGTDLLLRKTISVPSGALRLYFEFGADNSAYIYLDGNLVGSAINNTGCQTRGSNSFWIDAPSAGSHVIAVRAVDNALSELGGADGYAGVLKETFFDLKVEVIETTASESVTPGTDLAVGRSLLVGSSGPIPGAGCFTYTPNNPANATDGDIATASDICNGFQVDPGFTEGHWIADLDIDRVVTGVTIITGPSTAAGTGAGTVKVYYSTTSAAGPWTEAGTFVSYSGDDGIPHSVSFDPVSARYWKLQWEKDALGFYVGMRLAEFQVSAGVQPTPTMQPAGREPGDIVAILENQKSEGVSEYHNGPGELYFTLPNTHPAIGVILPWQTHWAYEVYTSMGWVEKQAGWITDYDATDEETIFYGLDYLGVLSISYDERFNPDQSPDAVASIYPDDPNGAGGAKYVEERIDTIVGDQLARAITVPNSNLGFFKIGAIASMPETVTIYCTLVERLSFIAGLLDSHRAGTGKRTRLMVVKYGSEYRFEVQDSPGMTRTDLTWRYGALVQGFRLIPFGDYGNRALGIGKTATGFRLEYDIEPTPAPPGQRSDYFELQYGRLSKPNYWSDIIDVNDLKRRAKQYAAQIGAVGKRLGVGLRVDAIGVKDGWEICDSVPVIINRGIVDTTTMTPALNGLWTIWGWSFIRNLDSHGELVTTLLPKELDGDADSTIGSSATVPPAQPFVTSSGNPDATVSPGSAGTWVNAVSGHVWTVDPVTGLWVDQTAAGAMPGLEPSSGWVRLEEFGAVGDGTTNDQAAWDAAYAACPAGGIIALKPGKNYLLDHLALDKDLQIRSFGTYPGGAATLTVSAGNTTFIEQTGVHFLTLDEVTVYNPGANASGSGIYVLGSLRTNRVHVRGFYDNVVIDASGAGQPFFSALKDSWFITAGRANVHLVDKVNNVTIQDCRIEDGQYGIYGPGGPFSIRLIGGSIEGHTIANVCIDGAGASQNTKAFACFGTYLSQISMTGTVYDFLFGATSQVYGVEIVGAYMEQTAATGAHHVKANFVSGLQVLGGTMVHGSEAGGITCDPTNTTNVTLLPGDWTGCALTVPASARILDPATDVTPADIGDANAHGSSAYLARADHVHKLGGTVGGDLSGTLPNPTVIQLQGRPVSSAAPVADNALVWNGSQWAPASVASSAHFLVISSTHSAPLVFDDIVQSSAGDDFVYST